MEKKKENALIDFREMISHSWTYEKLTIQEKKQLENVFLHIRSIDKLKGSYMQRWETLNMVYYSFLQGVGYTDFNWRD